MSQLTWTVLDDMGGKFHVGIYHGESTGHLVVYCNWKVILIDFNVLDTKDYSFYLGQEFCHLNIHKSEKGFSYGLQKDGDADTPLNLSRKNRDRADSLKSSAFMISLIILVLVIVYFIKAIS